MSELYHYGRSKRDGAKVGSGRYPLGSGKTVFVSGSSKTQNKDSIYFRKKLPKPVSKELKKYIKNKDHIIVGDAPGIDRQTQDYLKSKHYKNVTVYSTGDVPRYIANSKWSQEHINSNGYAPGSKDFNRQKDIAMTNAATHGLSVILENGGAGATRNNVKRLIDQNKSVKVFQLNSTGVDNWVENVIKDVYDYKI